VRSRLAEYANDLLSLGVDGFRLDAAKHIAAADIANITNINPSEYVAIGDVQEFRYTSALRNAFLGSEVSRLEQPDPNWVPSDVANVFVANHDTERNGDSLNVFSPANTYTLAHIFLLAHPYGSPTVLSSYLFSDKDHGAPNNGVGSCFGEGGTEGWYVVAGVPYPFSSPR